ncbi:hypothetical protein [Sporosarcina limicola]|uniref:Uncharacterized protein n=1 Tax=Sporosarcina limicola TaxID=34101 RepID=A0A927R649_9BACL|nr:hypothetical protein [Sporosarcina limicola]MBE1554609.1 hypothetical protein [Sporosarcina limicola]
MSIIYRVQVPSFIQLTLVDKAKRILKEIEFDLDLAFDWNKDYYDNYYQYFAHPNDEVR